MKGALQRPESEAEAADMIAAAAATGATIEIRGGGTRASIGRPAEADIVLSTDGLTGITAYRPEEMVLSARAGTPLAEIEAALAEHGQRLAFEPVDYRRMLGRAGEPTIGGVAATNNSGPRRILAGAARDSLLGVRYINGRGEILRSGGRVMKNVTGLDLARLLAGSWGTLGLLTEVTFKVLPRPETETSLVLAGLDDGQASAVMAHAMASSAEVSGAAHLPELVAPKLLQQEGAATVLRIEGFAESVADRIERLRARLGHAAPVRTLEAEASCRLWAEIAEVAAYCLQPQKPLWRVTLTPSEAPAFVMALRMAHGVDAFYDWQGGLVWMQPEDDMNPAGLREVLARHGGGNALLVRASPEFRRAAEVFHPVAPAIARLNEGIRRALDPQGIFQTGRIGF